MNTDDPTIEFDSETAKEDKSDGGIYPYDPAFESIEMTDNPFSVFEYLRQLEKGRIQIQPDFQRNLVWTNSQKSKFIESILLNFPLPPIYLNETKDSNYLVIDGLQRSTALYEFYRGNFALTGIEAIPKYNGTNFIGLPEILQSKFENKKLTVFVLKPSTPMVVIYDLFNRINTGGTQLNRQEVRNCIFIGKSTNLLRELAEEDYFRRGISWGVKPTRMKDREVILRYLAFRWFDFKNQYFGDMSEFVEEAMRTINKLPDRQIEIMKEDFKHVMETSFLIWSDRSFRIPTSYTKGTINVAVLESVCNFLSSKSKEYLTKNANEIRANYITLINDEKYYDSVTTSTGSKQKVLDRFALAHKHLSNITK